MIIDTDVGGEPDDAMALAIAARHRPDLALVITTDEHKGQRARFARAFLDALGRQDVVVVAGRQLSAAPYFWVQDLIPPHTRAQDTNVVAAVAAVCARAEGPVRWLGLGPMSNLAAVLRARPELASRLEITQMGGALAYRDPELAQYNFRLAPAAAAAVLAAAGCPRLVTYDVTFAPQELVMSADSPLLRDLAGADGTGWARLLVAQCQRYFTGYYPSTIPHTPLALSAALDERFIEFTPALIAVDERGRVRVAEDGQPVALFQRADYAAFTDWLRRRLDPAVVAA